MDAKFKNDTLRNLYEAIWMAQNCFPDEEIHEIVSRALGEEKDTTEDIFEPNKGTTIKDLGLKSPLNF